MKENEIIDDDDTQLYFHVMIRKGKIHPKMGKLPKDWDDRQEKKFKKQMNKRRKEKEQ